MPNLLAQPLAAVGAVSYGLWAMGFGLWALGFGHWTLDIGHWALNILSSFEFPNS